MLTNVLLFLDIGGPEMILILVVALLVFGGDKLPELARGLGKGIKDFKDAADGVKEEFHSTINQIEQPKTTQNLNTGFHDAGRTDLNPEYGSNGQSGAGEIAGGGIITSSHAEPETNQSFHNPIGYQSQALPGSSGSGLVDAHANPYPGHSDHPEHQNDFSQLNGFDQTAEPSIPAAEPPRPLIVPAANTLQYESAVTNAPASTSLASEDLHLRDDAAHHNINQHVHSTPIPESGELGESPNKSIDLGKPGDAGH